MSPDPDDPKFRAVLNVDDARRLFMEHAMGMHAYRVGFGGERYAATFTDVFSNKNDNRRTPMDVALSIIKREMLNKNVSIGLWNWGGGYINLWHDGVWVYETFTPNELQKFCLRIMELCAAWEGVDQHLGT